MQTCYKFFSTTSTVHFWRFFNFGQLWFWAVIDFWPFVPAGLIGILCFKSKLFWAILSCTVIHFQPDVINDQITLKSDLAVEKNHFEQSQILEIIFTSCNSGSHEHPFPLEMLVNVNNRTEWGMFGIGHFRFGLIGFCAMTFF